MMLKQLFSPLQVGALNLPNRIVMAPLTRGRSGAERIQTQPVGSVWKFSGFLATPKNGKNVILHIQEFKTL